MTRGDDEPRARPRRHPFVVQNCLLCCETRDLWTAQWPGWSDAGLEAELCISIKEYAYPLAALITYPALPSTSTRATVVADLGMVSGYRPAEDKKKSTTIGQ